MAPPFSEGIRMTMSKPIVSLLMAASVALAVGASAAAAPASVGGSSGSFDLEFESGLLTIEANDAPLYAILSEIGRQAGFEITTTEDVSIPVSASMAGEEVINALERLLAGFDWVLVYESPTPGSAVRPIKNLIVFESTGVAVDTTTSPDEMAATAGTMQSAETDELARAESRARARDLLRLVNSGASPEVLSTLGEALQSDDDAWVRGRAAAALGALQDERAVSDLAWALGDENASVRMQAIQALGQIGGDRAVWALGAALMNGATDLERIQAAWALGKQDSDLARQLLDAAEGDPNDLVRRASRTPPVRVQGRDDADAAGFEQRGPSSIQ